MTHAYYQPSPALTAQLNTLADRAFATFKSLKTNHLALSCLRYEQPDQLPQGGHYQGDKLFYPASIVKLFYLVYTHYLLTEQKLQDSAELQRALRDMIVDSSNDATALVADMCSQTTGGPELTDADWSHWVIQRTAINRYFQAFDWPEWQHINLCQKTWGDGPYGRERQLVEQQGRNQLTTQAVARLLHAIITDQLLSPAHCASMRALLQRDLHPDAVAQLQSEYDQVSEFFGGGLPVDTQIWSKAGDTSAVCHDAAFIQTKNCKPFILIAFSQGTRPRQWGLLPFLAEKLLQLFTP